MNLNGYFIAILSTSEAENHTYFLLFSTFLTIKNVTAVSSWLKSTKGVQNGIERGLFFLKKKKKTFSHDFNHSDHPNSSLPL